LCFGSLCQAPLPSIRLGCAAPADVPPGLENVIWNFKGRMGPAEHLAGSRNLCFAQWGTMGGGRALLVGGAKADDGPAGDEGRSAAIDLRRGYDGFDCIGIMPVDPEGLPAVGLEAP